VAGRARRLLGGHRGDRRHGPLGLHDLGLHRLELRHSTANPASCRVAARAGFRLEGTLRSAMRHPDGWHDMHLHARLQGDPEAAPGPAPVEP